MFFFPESFVQMVTGGQFDSQIFSSSHRLQQQIPRISFLHTNSEQSQMLFECRGSTHSASWW